MIMLRFVAAFLALIVIQIQPALAADTPKATESRSESTTVNEVRPNDLPVPRVLKPCTPGACSPDRR
ncbi:MAG TPA: hypothetical protein VFP68_13335 [Burkholderiaceae bacterium]|nr:hypothetical protein [Burkholderiaceae bacterium]